MVEFSGSLARADLPELIGFLGGLCEHGTLHLNQEWWSAYLALHDGRIVAAGSGSLRGRAAIMALSRDLDKASFVFVEGPGPTEGALDLTAEQLRDAFKQPDTGSRLSFDAIPRRRNGAHPDAEDTLTINRSALRTLLAVDGHRTVGELLGDGPVSNRLRTLADLLDLGLISIDPDQAPAVAAPPKALPLPWPSNNGEFERDGVSVLPAADPRVPPPRPAACPYLGFVDDPSQRYNGVTALHRCFASGTMASVSSIEQRDLCLDGSYARCPRYPEVLEEGAPVRRNGTSDHPTHVDPPAAVAPAAVRRGSQTAPAARPRHGIPLVPVLAIALAVGAVLAWLLILFWPSGGAAEVQPSVAPPAPVEQPSPTAVPTVAIVAAAAPATPVLVDSTFESSADAWSTNPPFAAWASGEYRLSSPVAARFMALAAPLTEPVADVEVKGVFRKLAGPSGGGYGLIVRDQDTRARDGEDQSGRYYVFEVSDRGEFGVWRREFDRWIDVLAWSPSEAVRRGSDPNELTVRVVGNTLTFLVNGVRVAEHTDSTLGPGGIGVFVGGDRNEVALERFSARRP